MRDLSNSEALECNKLRDLKFIKQIAYYDRALFLVSVENNIDSFMRVFQFLEYC